MIDSAVRARLAHWALFLVLVFIVYFLRLIPANPGTRQLPDPYWVVIFGYAWVIRRPDYVPTPLFAAAVFLGDVLFLRPLGLWSAISIGGLEFLRARAQFSRELPFLFEWAMVAGVIVLMAVANRVLLGVFIVNQPDLASTGIQLLLSILAYPLVVGISATLFGVRKVAPGATDKMGHRI